VGGPPRSREVRTRRWAALAIAVTIVLGLGSRALPIGIALWDKSFGDAAYAVMIYGVLLFLRPESRPRALGAATFVVCFAIEVFQLTGVPMMLPRLLRFALGTAFAWHDVACYVVGAALACALHARVART
jgi:hypothetical protein